MPYLGGKSATRKDGNGAWIASLLPPVIRSQVYCEPFAGMLGVLLQRHKAPQEIVNDIDGRIINWWRVVRDQPEAFARAIRYTPHSRVEFEAATERMANAHEHCDVSHAVDFTIITLQSITRGQSQRSYWLRRQDGANYGATWSANLENRIARLSDRIRGIQLEHMDAVELLRHISVLPHAVVYCDPPYKDTQQYAHNVDRDALREVLSAAKARVAISGYGTEWDSLGWHKETSAAIPLRLKTGSRRSESLWFNYEPTHRLL